MVVGEELALGFRRGGGGFTGISEGLADFEIRFPSPLDTIGVPVGGGVVFAMGGDTTFFVVDPGLSLLLGKESRFLANRSRTFGIDLTPAPGATGGFL